MAQMTMIQAITDALRTELRNDENVLFSVKTLELMAVFSVRLKVCKKNLVKSEYLILRLRNQLLVVLRLVLHLQGFRPVPGNSVLWISYLK